MSKVDDKKAKDVAAGKVDPTDESLGEAAYEAHCATRGGKDMSGVALPSWFDLSSTDRQPWAAAGAAAYYFEETPKE